MTRRATSRARIGVATIGDRPGSGERPTSPGARDDARSPGRFSGMKVPMDLAGKRVLVVGLAQTGIAVARFLARRGAHVLVNDGKPEAALADRLVALRD